MTIGEALRTGKVTHQRFTHRKLAVGAILYAILLVVFWFVAKFFGVTPRFQGHLFSTFLSFALMFAPYWFFGFGLGGALQKLLRGPAARILASTLFVAPYFVLSLPRGEFDWILASQLLALAVLVAAALQYSRTTGGLQDLLVLAALGVIVDLRFLHAAWPPGLGGFSKLILADIALYGYLVVKPLENIGYDLQPQGSDVKIGLREVLFYMPIVLPLGWRLGFLHFHPGLSRATGFPAAWIFTWIFVALPEELFFRGLVQNLLERRLGRWKSLALASVLFGLSHFNKGNVHGAVFNWRYVLLAAIAGVFYGRAWRARHRLFASSITHATVDTVWSIWFR